MTFVFGARGGGGILCGSCLRLTGSHDRAGEVAARQGYSIIYHGTWWRWRSEVVGVGFPRALEITPSSIIFNAGDRRILSTGSGVTPSSILFNAEISVL